MFLVYDSHVERVKKIRSLIDFDIVIAVIVAAVYFEWTVRRAILALGASPTKYIRENYLKGATFKQYPQIWNKEVYPRLNKRIGDVLSNFAFGDNPAFTLRNRIVHGELGSVKFDFGKEKVEEILTAIEELNNFAITQYEPLSGRRIVRKKAR